MTDTYPTIRALDGLYFRIKRGENWVAICFTDMTDAEREEVMEGRSAEWMGSLALCLADRLREIADELDIVKRPCFTDDGADICFESRKGKAGKGARR